MRRSHLLALSAAAATGLALYAGFSTLGFQEDKKSTRETGNQSGIIYSDVALENAGTAVTPRVYGSASPDVVPGRYKYSYTVVNEPSSSNAVWKFVLDPTPRPLSVTAPANWMWNYGYQLRDRALAFASEGDSTPYAGSWDSVSVVPSSYDLQPGDSLTFDFVSDGSPSMIRFYVQGFYNDSLGTEDEGGSPPQSVYTNGITGVVIGPATTVGVPGSPDSFEPPAVPKLQAPAPNPTSTSATVAFYLPRPGRVQLGVYDVSGRLVQMVEQRTYPAGYHSVVWRGLSSSGARMPAGVYFFRLKVDGKPAGAQKMIMVR